MTLGPLLTNQLEQHLNDLRDATINRDISRADRIYRVLIDFLRPEGYTLVEDSKLVYRLEKIKGVSTGQ